MLHQIIKKYEKYELSIMSIMKCARIYIKDDSKQ